MVEEIINHTIEMVAGSHLCLVKDRTLVNNPICQIRNRYARTDVVQVETCYIPRVDVLPQRQDVDVQIIDIGCERPLVYLCFGKMQFLNFKPTCTSCNMK